MSMLIFLPDNFDIPIIEAALSSENLDKWLATLEYKTVEVTYLSCWPPSGAVVLLLINLYM